MSKIFTNQEVPHIDPEVFEVEGRYSMDDAVEILTWLEGLPDCEIGDLRLGFRHNLTRPIHPTPKSGEADWQRSLLQSFFRLCNKIKNSTSV